MTSIAANRNSTELYILRYEVVDDYISLRAPYRAQHLALADTGVQLGELILGGALAEPADGAMLIFTSNQAARAFAANDPYVTNGLVTNWTIRKWTVVAGTLFNQLPIQTVPPTKS